MYTHEQARRLFTDLAAGEGWILRPELWAKHAPQEVDPKLADKFRNALKLLSVGQNWYYDRCLKIVMPSDPYSALAKMRFSDALAWYEKGYEEWMAQLRANDGAPLKSKLRLQKMARGRVHGHPAWLGKLLLGLEEANYALRFETRPDWQVAAFLRGIGLVEAQVGRETRFLSVKSIREITPDAGLVYESPDGCWTRYRMFAVIDPTSHNTVHPVIVYGFSCVGDTQELLHVVAASDPSRWEAHKGSTEYDPFVYWVKQNGFMQ